MARTRQTTQQITKTGLSPTLTAPKDGGDVIDTGRVYLEVNNTGSAAATVTVITPIEIDGLKLEDLVVSVPAGATRKIGLLAPSTFGQPAGSPDAGLAYVDYQGSDLKRGVFGL